MNKPLGASSVQYRDCIPLKEEFWRLFSSTGWNEEYHLSPDELIAAISHSWRVISAYENDRLVGFGRVVSDGVLHAMIYDLIVDPSEQGQGIGGEVLDQLIRACRSEGIRDIQLFCAKGKRAFYEKRGFTSRPQDAPGMDFAIVTTPEMKKKEQP